MSDSFARDLSGVEKKKKISEILAKINECSATKTIFKRTLCFLTEIRFETPSRDKTREYKDEE